MKKRMKEIVKKHLMTLGVVVGVCGALMIIIPTCGGEEKAAEPTGYSEEYLDAYSPVSYTHLDVYKRQGVGLLYIIQQRGVFIHED